MDLVAFLTSESAQTAIAELASRPFDPARDVPQLRRSFDREQSAAIAEMLVARPLAQTKFGHHADQMVYFAEAVRQATPWQVARHRSRRFTADGVRADLCCGIGGDALWLGPKVVGVDLDRVRLDMARHNAAVAGVELIPLRADLDTYAGFDAEEVFADPGRRDANGRRIFDVERYRPPLGVLLSHWRHRAAGMAVKLHPGVDLDTLPDGVEVEFVSLDGDLKEACLWLGTLTRQEGTRATVLPSGACISGRPLALAPDVSDVSTWLFEPDAAVIRSGLVGDAAVALGLRAIDPTIAYLTGSVPVDSTLVTGYRVLDVMPFHGKKIKAHLRRRNIGSVTVKKRGSPIEPDRFRRQLDLTGDDHCVVILTRAAGKPVAIIADESVGM